MINMKAMFSWHNLFFGGRGKDCFLVHPSTPITKSLYLFLSKFGKSVFNVVRDKVVMAPLCLTFSFIPHYFLTEEETQ